MRIRPTSLLIALLLSAPVAPALADQPAPPAAPAADDIATEVDAAMSDKSQNDFKAGNTHYRAGRYPEALASYKAAFALDAKNVKILHNLGMAELKLGMHRDAAEHLTLAHRLSDAKDPMRARMEGSIAEEKKKVGTIAMKVKSGGVEVDGVEIVDMATGRTYTTPLVDPIFVNAGKVSFRIRREGYESQEKVLDMAAGGEARVDIALTRPAGYVGPGGGTGGAGGSGVVEAPRSKVPGFVMGGVGVAALIAGGVLVGVGVSKGGEVHNTAPRDDNGNPICNRAVISGEDPRCAGARSTAQSASLMGNVGVGLLVGGGVVAAAGAAYLFIPSRSAASDSKRAARVVPVIGSQGGGLVFTGSF